MDEHEKQAKAFFDEKEKREGSARREAKRKIHRVFLYVFIGIGVLWVLSWIAGQ